MKKTKGGTSMRHTYDTSRLDIITPVKLEADWPTNEDLVETCAIRKSITASAGLPWVLRFWRTAVPS